MVISCPPQFVPIGEHFKATTTMNDDAAAKAGPVRPGPRARPGVATPGVPVMPVSLFVSSARLLFERQLGLTWIGGEISGFTRAASGHCYFKLKDAARRSAACSSAHKAQALASPCATASSVEVRATPTIYDARGEFQLTVDTVRLAGLGALYERFAQLKARARGRRLVRGRTQAPAAAFPRARRHRDVARAAALRDMLTTLARRWPALPVILYPAAVQGAGAARRDRRGHPRGQRACEVDVLIVCRGGGSIEDLWAFNEEAVARAVFESRAADRLRRGPRDRLHDLRFRRRRARAHAHRRGDARRARARGAARTHCASCARRLARAHAHGVQSRAAARRRRAPARASGGASRAAGGGAARPRATGSRERSRHRQRARSTAARRARGRGCCASCAAAAAGARALQLTRARCARGRERSPRARARMSSGSRRRSRCSNPEAVLERGYAIVTGATARS